MKKKEYIFVDKRYVNIIAAFYTKRNPYWFEADRCNEDWNAHLREKRWWTKELDEELTRVLAGLREIYKK